MEGVWGKNLRGEKNVSLAFTVDLKDTLKGKLNIAGADCFKVYADGKLLYFGPSRAAHGYARVAEVPFCGRRIAVIVHSNFVYQFCWIKQNPFFACELTAGGKTYTAKDFNCFKVTDRLKKVPRYSFQRGFSEIYREKENFDDFLNGKDIFEKIKTEKAKVPELLPTYNKNPALKEHYPVRVIERGGVKINADAKPFRDRSHYIEEGFIEGYKIEEWEDSATDDASRFEYFPYTAGGCDYNYVTYDFGRSITGFTEAEVYAKAGAVLYVVYDEILSDNLGKGKNHISFERNETANVLKWTFDKEGAYRVSSFDPYTLRYAVIVCKDDVEIKSFIQRDFENPLADRFVFKCRDKKITEIVEAARATLAQNSVDILTDCPQRERAGWLSDSWFSSLAERLFTGENAAEKTFLENYVLSDKKFLPKGMVPMCYPSDHPEKVFIPNWAMWYIAEIYKYSETYGRDELVEKSKDNVFGILNYLENFENEYGLLEDLKSWVFVEWSEANDGEHVKGVNVPTNACYAYVLYRAGQLYGIEEFKEKAEKIRAKIRELAFDGRFFVDNLVRDENGKLKQSGLLTEVCQYYLFRFYCLDKTEYKDLYRELMDNLGTNRKEGYLPKIAKPNVMYGVYMRLDLLTADGEREEVLKECLKLFGVMAEKTGTLWENLSPKASCNHGFAAYAMRWIIFAISGYDILRNRLVDSRPIGVDCQMKIPRKNGDFTEVSVKDGKTQVKEIVKNA